MSFVLPGYFVNIGLVISEFHCSFHLNGPTLGIKSIKPLYASHGFALGVKGSRLLFLVHFCSYGCSQRLAPSHSFFLGTKGCLDDCSRNSRVLRAMRCKYLFAQDEPPQPWSNV